MAKVTPMLAKVTHLQGCTVVTVNIIMKFMWTVHTALFLNYIVWLTADAKFILKICQHSWS